MFVIEIEMKGEKTYELFRRSKIIWHEYILPKEAAKKVDLGYYIQDNKK